MGTFAKPLVVLAYHGITSDLSSVLNDFCFVTPEKLDSDLKQIAEEGWSFIGLQEGLADLKRGALRQPSVAITFDDGLSSVEEHGRSILLRHGCRGTIFVPSVISTERQSLWYTRVICALRSTRLQKFEFLGRVFSLSNFADRVYANIVIQNALKLLHPRAISALLSELLLQLEVEPQSMKRDLEVLSPDDCSRLRKEGVFAFGAHSATHAIHSLLSETELKAEIKHSLCFLERIQDQTPLLYAYPNGRKQDFSSRCRMLLSENNVFSALTTLPGWNFANRDLYSIRRFCVGQGTRLKYFLSGLRWRLQGVLS